MTETVNPVTMTERAAARARQMLEKRGTPEAAIRIGVATKGCSGYSYKLEYADVVAETDQCFESQGIRIVVDGKSMIFVAGTQVDYIADPFRAGFKFTNPREKGQCGCGESFTI